MGLLGFRVWGVFQVSAPLRGIYGAGFAKRFRAETSRRKGGACVALNGLQKGFCGVELS